jgi:hypothetical protein
MKYLISFKGLLNRRGFNVRPQMAADSHSSSAGAAIVSPDRQVEQPPKEAMPAGDFRCEGVVNLYD